MVIKTVRLRWLSATKVGRQAGGQRAQTSFQKTGPCSSRKCKAMKKKKSWPSNREAPLSVLKAKGRSGAGWETISTTLSCMLWAGRVPAGRAAGAASGPGSSSKSFQALICMRSPKACSSPRVHSRASL